VTFHESPQWTVKEQEASSRLFDNPKDAQFVAKLQPHQKRSQNVLDLSLTTSSFLKHSH
jgi:hypothetical protein